MAQFGPPRLLWTSYGSQRAQHGPYGPLLACHLDFWALYWPLLLQKWVLMVIWAMDVSYDLLWHNRGYIMEMVHKLPFVAIMGP